MVHAKLDPSEHFAKLPNGLALAWACRRLSSVEWSILLVLVATQLGAYNPTDRCVGRRDVEISVRDLAEATSYTRQAIHTGVRRLEAGGLVEVVGRGSGTRPMSLALRTDVQALVSNARWTLGAEENERQRPLDTSGSSVQRPLDACVQRPLDTTKPLKTLSEKEETACGAALDAPPAVSDSEPITGPREDPTDSIQSPYLRAAVRRAGATTKKRHERTDSDE